MIQQDFFLPENHFNEDHHGFGYLEHARAIARRLGEKGRILTIDDVREQAPTPEHIDGRILGAVFKTKEWEPVGYTRTRNPNGHGDIRRTWRLINE